MTTHSRPLVDSEFAPVLQWTSRVGKKVALAGWAYFLLAMGMAYFGNDFGPAGRQLNDTVSESGWLMFGLLTALSVLVWLASKLATSAAHTASAETKA